jgi:hypothetical protein
LADEVESPVGKARPPSSGAVAADRWTEAACRPTMPTPATGIALTGACDVPAVVAACAAMPDVDEDEDEDEDDAVDGARCTTGGAGAGRLGALPGPGTPEPGCDLDEASGPTGEPGAGATGSGGRPETSVAEPLPPGPGTTRWIGAVIARPAEGGAAAGGEPSRGARWTTLG